MRVMIRMLKDGDKCKVEDGTHKGKPGVITITVVQANRERFKTLAKNVC